jgi:hypothetical protein
MPLMELLVAALLCRLLELLRIRALPLPLKSIYFLKMPEYTFPILIEPLKNNNTIQTIFDTNALVAPIKAAIADYIATLGLPAAETAHLNWENCLAGIYLEQLVATYHLPSLGIQTPAPAIKRNTKLLRS